MGRYVDLLIYSFHNSHLNVEPTIKEAEIAFFQAPMIAEVSLLEMTNTSPQCINYWTLTFNVWPFKSVCLVCGQQTVQIKCTLLDSVFLLICYRSERKIAMLFDFRHVSW